MIPIIGYVALSIFVKPIQSGYLTKQQVNKHGYNKFLKISKDVEVLISQDKIAEDEK